MPVELVGSRTMAMEFLGYEAAIRLKKLIYFVFDAVTFAGA